MDLVLYVGSLNKGLADMRFLGLMLIPTLGSMKILMSNMSAVIFMHIQYQLKCVSRHH